MKKITKLFLLLSLPVCAIAQPNITSADFPGVGSKWGDIEDGRTGIHYLGAS